VRSPRLTPYENLLGAKIFWLIRQIDAHQSAAAVDGKQLKEAGADVQGAITEHQRLIDSAKAELRVLDGNDEAAKKKLVKQNVESWIRNLRSRAADYRRYARDEEKQAAEADNEQNRDQHEANAHADTEEANHDENMAGELSSDLGEAKL
jgi:hypothetical protein